jgi:hypothetical protein
MPINLYLNYEREKIGLSPPKRWDLITTEDKPLTSGATNSVKAIRDVFDYPIGSPRIEVLGKPLDGNYLTNLGISVLKPRKNSMGPLVLPKRMTGCPSSSERRSYHRGEMFLMFQKKK